MSKRKNLTLKQLMIIVNDHYPDSTILDVYLHQEKDPGNDDTHGDTLALFIVRELIDTYDPQASTNHQLTEAMRVIVRARDDLERVHDGLHKAFTEMTTGVEEE